MPAPLNWVAQEDELTSAALTVRAQTISPNDTGALLWDVFMPRRNVDSVKISEISTVDFRPAADRREWNARGRNIPLRTPNLAELEMVPIEAFFSVDEREIQRLTERAFGNEPLFRQLLGAEIPQRVDSLVASDFRRVEFDVMQAWAAGTVTAMDPGNGVSYTTSYGFDVARYQTAGTIWSNGGLNAYDEFIAWCEDGIDAIGAIAGAMLRLATFKEIQKDAPQGINGIQLTRAQVQAQVSADLGTSFRFYIVETSLDKFTDAGIAVTRTKVWAAHKVALIPAGAVVGFTAFAPIARSYELARSVPEARIDVRGVAVFNDVSGTGREMTVEAQLNAMPVPDENKMWVIDAGV